VVEAVPPCDLVLSEASWQGDGDGGDFAQHLTAAQAGGDRGAIGATDWSSRM
jgi:hypothetical protein